VSGLDRACTLPDLVLHAAASDRGIDFKGLDRRGPHHGYAQLVARARGVAARLRAEGVLPGDRVALVLETSPEFFDAWFGALLAGAVPACLYPPVRLGRLRDYHRRTADMVGAIGARVVIASRVVARLLGKTRELVGPRVAFARIEDWRGARDDGVPVPPIDPDALALIQFSSGTTVAPKPVALTHRQLLANLASMIGWFGGDVARHVTVSWLPLYHDMGLVGAAMLSLVAPTPLVLVRPEHFVARPQLWLQAISDARATVTVAPNFAYGLCVERIDDKALKGVDLSCLEVALNGAEPVHPGTIARFVARFAPYGLKPEVMTPVYGLAEVGLAVSFAPKGKVSVPVAFAADALEVELEAVLDRGAGEETRELASVGPPLAGNAIEIRDEFRAPLGERRVGSVWVQGPSLMHGYHGLPEATAQVKVDGWLDTGDLGFLLDGELYLCGRAKDVLVLRGRNHDPAAIEQAASELDGVRKGCVIALALPLPDEDSDGLLLLVERRREGEREDEALAIALHQAALEACGVAPTDVVLLEPGTLPRTSSGKLRRSTALRQYMAGELTPPDRVTWFSMARELFESWLAHRRVAAAEDRRRT